MFRLVFRHALPPILAALAAILPFHAAAQHAAPGATVDPGPSATGDGDGAAATLGTIVITAPAGERKSSGRLGERDIAPRRASTSDSASLLKDIPGVSVYGAGGISSLPAVHGLADDRLRTLVDGMDLMSACPNHMNPALSFIDPTRLASVEVFAGITPVSVGGDSIGGTIQARSAPPKFAKVEAGLLVEGQAGRFSRSNGRASGDHAGFTVAGEFLNLSYNQSGSKSDNYWAGGNFKITRPMAWQQFGERPNVPQNEVTASEYRGSRHRDLGLAMKVSGHLLELKVSEQRLAYEGFPNQRMDMISSIPDAANPGSYVLDKGKPANVNRLVNLHYAGQYEWGELDGRLFRQDLTHHMDMIQDRFQFMFMPMDTVASTVGGSLMASISLSDTDLLRLGSEFQKYRLDDWWPALGVGVLPPGAMCCNDFWNVRDGKRDGSGVFAEWEARWSPAWLSLLGIRFDTVASDAGTAQGYSTLPMYARNAARFNARQHARRDRHLDLTALVRHAPDATQTYEAGFARKTRSPNLYERYPWSYESMSSAMNNFVGDGNAYIGNLDLRPETAHTISGSADWHDAARERWKLKLTAYATHVFDYIDAIRCAPGMSAIPAQCTAANVTTSNQYVKLVYANHAARLQGIDLSGQALLGHVDGLGSFTLTGALSQVRGKNRATGDNLYHIMPRDTRLGLVHRLGGWTNTLALEHVGAKTQVSAVRNEIRTPAYTLVNVYTSYEWKHARLDLGVENAGNKFHLLPLGGAYLGQGNAMTLGGVPWGMGVPGRGRSGNVSLSLRF